MSRRAKKQMTKGPNGIAARRLAYYKRFRGGKNRVMAKMVKK